LVVRLVPARSVDYSSCGKHVTRYWGRFCSLWSARCCKMVLVCLVRDFGRTCYWRAVKGTRSLSNRRELWLTMPSVEDLHISCRQHKKNIHSCCSTTCNSLFLHVLKPMKTIRTKQLQNT
jgi:hypothetical protein